jgi:uncharacterized protein YndB with AHSA1/START domain
MDNNPIVMEKEFNATVESVWKALTDRDEMKKWYFDLKEFRAEKGFQFSFYGGHEDGVQYKHLCEITEAIPDKKLAYTWRYEGFEGISEVSFELFPKGEKTLVRLRHAGLETFPQNEPDFAKHNFIEGWTHIINVSLKNYLEG